MLGLYFRAFAVIVETGLFCLNGSGTTVYDSVTIADDSNTIICKSVAIMGGSKAFGLLFVAILLRNTFKNTLKIVDNTSVSTLFLILFRYCLVLQIIN